MQVIELPDANFEPLSLGFSPDGRLLAGWSWGRVCVLDTATGTVRAMLGEKEIHIAPAPGVGFTADGRGVVGFRDAVTPPVCVYDLDSGAVLRRCPAGLGQAVEVGPGGRFVYLAGGSGEWVKIVRWNPHTGKGLPAVVRHKGSVRRLAVSADEKWVAGAGGNAVRVWQLDGPKSPAREFAVADGSVRGLALSSDGAFVAYNGPGVRVANVGTGETWAVSGGGSPYSREIAFHPARPVLAYSGGTGEVALYDTAAHAELTRLAWGIGSVSATAFSPDGLRCAAAGVGKVVVWDVDA